MSPGRRRALIAIAVLCVAGGAGYLTVAVLEPDEVKTAARPTGVAGAPVELAQAELLARAVVRDDRSNAGEVFAVDSGQPRLLSGRRIECERVHYAADRGLCLSTGANRISYKLTVFDSSLRPLHELPLAGLPSRARVSPDGRYGGTTVFVNGHEYLGAGGFSTATTIVDLHSGESLGNLESFKASKGGQPIEAADVNYWGLTFAPEDSDRFYATLRTGEHYYLVEGDIRARAMRVLRDGVECPSLSPDGTRIAFKSRIGEGDRWRLEVLDLDTLRAHAVAERRSIDDQPEWLDDATLVYSDGLDVYTVSADGSGVARLVLRNASSPVSLLPDATPARTKPQP